MKDYVVIVQCDIVKQRCSGYLCEQAFHERSGRFFEYPKDAKTRLLTMTCGGCCGRAVHRKLVNLIRKAKKKEDLDKGRIRVHLSSCIANDNYHGPPCPHKDYLKTLIRDKLGLELVEATTLTEQAVNELKEKLAAGE